MTNKRARPKVRKHLGKLNPKVDVVDEWEEGNIDRDEQKAGLERRERRWKEIQLAQKEEAKLNKKAMDNADKMERGNILRDPTPLELAWLRCDFILSHLMEQKAYEFMEYQRINDAEVYKQLYRKFMSRHMMLFAQAYMDFFAKGGKAPRIITFGEVVQAYKKIKGIKTKFKVIHKGEDEKEL